MTVNPTGPVDAVFRLLDRQILDCEDRLVAKVDDLELVQGPDGRLAATALLVGPGALGPRLGGRLGAWWVAIWRRLHPDAAPRPGRIPLGDLTRLDNAVRVSGTRAAIGVEGLEEWVDSYVVSRLPGAREGRGRGHPDTPAPRAPSGTPGPSATGTTRRLNDLLGCRVVGSDGHALGYVNDVRVLLPIPAHHAPLVGLIVDNRPRGTLLGYERRPQQRPAAVRALVRLAHRTAGYAPWPSVRGVDWTTRTVTLTVSTLDDLPI